MIEIIGTIATVIAIVGVVANNRKLRWCFLLWFFSNALCLYIHVSAGIWSLAGRDAIFVILAVEGYILWGKNESNRR